MQGILTLLAVAVVGQAAAVEATSAPGVDGRIETAIATLDGRVETKTLAKLQELVERDVAWLTRGLLRREARRVLAMSTSGTRAPQTAPFRI